MNQKSLLFIFFAHMALNVTVADEEYISRTKVIQMELSESLKANIKKHQDEHKDQSKGMGNLIEKSNPLYIEYASSGKISIEKSIEVDQLTSGHSISFRPFTEIVIKYPEGQEDYVKNEFGPLIKKNFKTNLVYLKVLSGNSIFFGKPKMQSELESAYKKGEVLPELDRKRIVVEQKISIRKNIKPAKINSLNQHKPKRTSRREVHRLKKTRLEE